METLLGPRLPVDTPERIYLSSEDDLMPALNEHFGDPERNNRSRFTARVGHWLPAAAVVALAVNMIGWFARSPVTTTAGYIGPLIIIIGVCHLGSARLCLRCMEAVPADAPSRAERQRWILRAYHATMGSHRFLSGFLIVFLAVIVAGYFLAPLDSDGHVSGDWRVLMDAAFNVASTLMVLALWVHHKLTPWCPYCRPWDHGGDPELVPTPDPSGIKSA